MNGYQGEPWSEELDSKNFTERLVAIWSRENPLFLAHRQHGQLAFHQLQVLYYAGFKGAEV